MEKIHYHVLLDCECSRHPKIDSVDKTCNTCKVLAYVVVHNWYVCNIIFLYLKFIIWIAHAWLNRSLRCNLKGILLRNPFYRKYHKNILPLLSGHYFSNIFNVWREICTFGLRSVSRTDEVTPDFVSYNVSSVYISCLKTYKCNNKYITYLIIFYRFTIALCQLRRPNILKLSVMCMLMNNVWSKVILCCYVPESLRRVCVCVAWSSL